MYEAVSLEEAKKLGLSEAQRKIPRPLKPEDPGRLDLRSKLEWQSVGRVRIDLAKLIAPARWQYIQANPSVKYKNSQMWWDIHLLHRKRLVMFKKFPEDEEQLEDILDDIEEDKRIR